MAGVAVATGRAAASTAVAVWPKAAVEKADRARPEKSRAGSWEDKRISRDLLLGRAPTVTAKVASNTHYSGGISMKDSEG